MKGTHKYIMYTFLYEVQLSCSQIIIANLHIIYCYRFHAIIIMSIKFFNLNNVPLHELNIPIRNMYGHAETRTSGPLGATHK